MSVRLIVVHKNPGVCLVVVEETWRQLFTEIVIRVTVLETTSACQDYHMCAGLKARIDGAVHGVQAFWDTKLTT